MTMRVKIDHHFQNFPLELLKETKIEELKLKLAQIFDAPVLRQRLYCGGKLLVDGHSLFDYGIVHGNTIEMMIQRPAPAKGMLLEEEEISLTHSKYFKVGDVIDAQRIYHYAWFKAKISAILKRVQNNAMVQKNENEGKTLLPNTPSNNEEKSSEFDPIYDDTTEENIRYTVTYDDYDGYSETLTLQRIRPRAKTVLKYEDINEGDTVMVNYNFEENGELGFWYDYIVDEKEVTGTSKILVGTILIGLNTRLPDSKINPLHYRIFAIEKNTPLCDRKVEEMTSNDEECVHERTKVIFDLPVEIKNLISTDIVNNDLWQECLENVSVWSKKFLEIVKENFLCKYCQMLVFDPVTTCCGHNICKKCLQNSYKAGIYACPVCRAALDKKAVFLVNAVLREILLKLFPGYQHGR